MSKMDIALGMIFDRLKIRSKELLSERVLIQKKIYLLQRLGIDLGYNFNWYLKGPYSPALTSFVYDKLDVMLDSNLEKYSLNEKVIDKINKINSIANEMSSDSNLSESQWYELVASIDYLYDNFTLYTSKKPDNEEVIKKLISEKPQYTKEQCKSAIVVLEKYGLFN